MDTMTLEYIFDRDRMQDPFDGSLWLRGETRKLEREHAERLLRHPDCWKVTQKKAKLVRPRKEVIDEEEEIELEEDIQLGMPQLTDMTKDQLVQFAKAQFDKDLDGKMRKDALVEEVRNLIAASQ